MNEVNMPMNVLGKRINPGVEGFFGVLASFVYLYGLFTSKQWIINNLYIYNHTQQQLFFSLFSSTGYLFYGTKVTLPSWLKLLDKEPLPIPLLFCFSDGYLEAGTSCWWVDL